MQQSEKEKILREYRAWFHCFEKKAREKTGQDIESRVEEINDHKEQLAGMIFLIRGMGYITAEKSEDMLNEVDSTFNEKNLYGIRCCRKARIIGAYDK